MGKNEGGPFARLFMVVGLVAGGAAGLQAGDFMSFLIGAILLAAVGFWIGSIADAVLLWLIFIITSIIAILINAAIRRFLWELISAVFAGA